MCPTPLEMPACPVWNAASSPRCTAQKDVLQKAAEVQSSRGFLEDAFKEATDPLALWAQKTMLQKAAR